MRSILIPRQCGGDGEIFLAQTSFTKWGLFYFEVVCQFDETPHSNEDFEYINNSCLLKPKTEFSFNKKQYRIFFLNLSDYFFQKLKLKFFPLSKSGNSMLFY